MWSRYVESIFEHFNLASRSKPSDLSLDIFVLHLSKWCLQIWTSHEPRKCCWCAMFVGSLVGNQFPVWGQKTETDGDNCQFAARAIHLKMLSMFCAPASDELFASSLPGDHCAESMNISEYLRIYCGSPKRKSLYSYLYPRILHTSCQSPFTFNHLHKPWYLPWNLWFDMRHGKFHPDRKSVV